MRERDPETGQIVTKYYFAGAARIAMRKYTIPQPMQVEYLLGDHPSTMLRTSLGSTSLTTDKTGEKVSEIHYKPCPYGMLREGEIRSTWTKTQTTTPDYRLSKFTFTGQYSYMDDPTTAGVEEGFKLLYYGARWYDPALGRFSQADSIIPGAGDSQAWDRFAGMNNNPVKYADPSGHAAIECYTGDTCGGDGDDGGGDGGGDDELFPNVSGTQFQIGINIGWTFNHPYGEFSNPYRNHYMAATLYYSLNLVTDENGGVQLYYTKRDLEFVQDMIGSHLEAGEAELAFPTVDFAFSFSVQKGVIGGSLFEDLGTEAYDGEAIDYQGGLGPVGADFYAYFDEYTRGIDPSKLWGADLSVSAGAPIGVGRIAQNSIRLTNRIQLPPLLIDACKVAGYCGGWGLP